MRDRLVAALVGMTVLVVVLYGVPRGFAVADLVESQAARATQRSADLVAAVVSERVDAGRPVSADLLSPLLGAGEEIRYVSSTGEEVVVGMTDAGANGEDDIVASRSLDGGGALTVTMGSATVRDRVAEAVLPLALLGLALVGVSAVVGVLLARRLARPFSALAQVAQELGRGQFDIEVPHSRVAEAEAIGAALSRASRQLDDLLARERSFALEASHELRTPIAALRLELEDLIGWPQTPSDVAAELRGYLSELDRLNRAISTYLDGAKNARGRSSEPTRRSP